MVILTMTACWIWETWFFETSHVVTDGPYVNLGYVFAVVADSFGTPQGSSTMLDSDLNHHVGVEPQLSAARVERNSNQSKQS